jgi:hypothetical protein
MSKQAEDWIDSRYHSKAGLTHDNLIEDKTGKEVGYGEIAESYHQEQSKAKSEVEELMAELIAVQKVRIHQLEVAAMKLYVMVHEGDLIEFKIKANDLLETIKP